MKISKTAGYLSSFMHTDSKALRPTLECIGTVSEVGDRSRISERYGSTWYARVYQIEILHQQ